MKSNEKQILTVKEVEVVVNEKTLEFEVNGKAVVLERQLGMSDYRIVYNYLKLKNPNKEKGTYSVGNFSYSIDDEGNVSISSTNYNFENAFVFDKEVANFHQILRNAVIKFLLENIE